MNTEDDNIINLTIEQYADLWKSRGSSEDSLEANLLNFMIVSFISSDTLLTKQDCLRSKNELIKMKTALEKEPSVKEDKREYYLKTLTDCIAICDRDFNELPN